jgi:hypothetical protein
VNGTAQDDTPQDGSVRYDIAGYSEAVRAALSGVPATVRDELVEDLPEHLAEVAAEGDLVATLGTPEAYAAELLAAAGHADTTPDPASDRFAEVRQATIRRLRTMDDRLGPVLGYRRASEFLLLLRPAWWVLRGYLAAMIVAWALDDSGQPIGLLPRIGGSEVVALLLLVAGILGSIWLGRRTAATGLAPWPRYALYSGSVVLVLVALGGFLNVDVTARGSGYSQVDYNDPYSQVRDLYIYDDQGRLVTGARVFDQDGQPIRLGDPYCATETIDTVPVPQPLGRYPYCPDAAPFRNLGADPSGQPSASPSPSLSGAPTATATATPAPSSSAVPDPSASGAPRPSATARPTTGR